MVACRFQRGLGPKFKPDEVGTHYGLMTMRMISFSKIMLQIEMTSTDLGNITAVRCDANDLHCYSSSYKLRTSLRARIEAIFAEGPPRQRLSHIQV